MHKKYDIVVIGGGPAGQKAAVQGAKAGRSVAMVDREATAGGECVHRGTIPSKTLREYAVKFEALRHLTGSERKALIQPETSVGGMMSRLGSVLEAHESYMAAQLERNQVDRIQGLAKFLSANQLEVRGPLGETMTIEAELIFVATGSRPRTPSNVDVDHEHILDSDSILSLIYIPRSLIVLGAGVIAAEFATVFAALGTKVTIVDRGTRPMPFLDEELMPHFLEDFAKSGGVYLNERELERAAWNGSNACEVVLSSGEVLRSEKVLCALGRTASTRGLNLECVGLELTSRGYFEVDENGCTSAPNIYAIGDVIGPPALAASAMEQGRRSMCHALGLPLPPDACVVPAGIYTIPEMASIGMTEAEAIERNGSAIVGRSDFGELARGQISGDEFGLLKLVSDPEGRELLGAHIIGRSATELIHLAQMAMVGGSQISVFADNIFNFPTMAEAYRVAALDIAGQVRAKLRLVG